MGFRLPIGLSCEFGDSIDYSPPTKIKSSPGGAAYFAPTELGSFGDFMGYRYASPAGLQISNAEGRMKNEETALNRFRFAADISSFIIFHSSFVLCRHSHADGLAPHAHAGVVDLINGAVGPHGVRGRERLRVGVAGRGVHGQHHKTLAVAAIHLDFAAVQKSGVSAPVPFHLHLPADDDDGDDRLEGGVIRPGLGAADNAEDVGISVRAFAAVLDALHERKDAVERAGVDGHHAGGQSRSRKNGQRHQRGAIAGLGFGGGGGAGLRPVAGGRQPKLEDIDQPAAIRHGAGYLRGGQVQGGGQPRQFAGKVGVPDDLVVLRVGVINCLFSCFDVFYV